MRDSWLDRIFTGHVHLGPLTIYGANAMHWAVNLRLTRLRTLCFHPTTRTFGGRWRWYVYLSPDCTPSTAYWGFGPGFRQEGNSAQERAECRARREWCE